MKVWACQKSLQPVNHANIIGHKPAEELAQLEEEVEGSKTRLVRRVSSCQLAFIIAHIGVFYTPTSCHD
jgi:hypothetical protein